MKSDFRAFGSARAGSKFLSGSGGAHRAAQQTARVEAGVCYGYGCPEPNGYRIQPASPDVNVGESFPEFMFASVGDLVGEVNGRDVGAVLG